MAVPTVAMDMEDLQPLVEPLTESTKKHRLSRTGLAFAAVGIAAASVAVLKYATPWTSSVSPPVVGPPSKAAWQQMFVHPDKADMTRHEECALLQELVDYVCHVCSEECIDVLYQVAECLDPSSAGKQAAIVRIDECAKNPPPPQELTEEERAKCLPALSAFETACPMSKDHNLDFDKVCEEGCQDAMAKMESDCSTMPDEWRMAFEGSIFMVKDGCNTDTCFGQAQLLKQASLPCNIQWKGGALDKAALKACDAKCKPILCGITGKCRPGLTHTTGAELYKIRGDIEEAMTMKDCSCEA